MLFHKKFLVNFQAYKGMFMLYNKIIFSVKYIALNILTFYEIGTMVLTLQISIMGCMNIRLSYHFPWLVLTSKMRATNIFMQVILAQARFLSFPRLLTVLYCAHIYPYSDIFFLLCLNFQVHGNSFNHPKDFSNML